MSKSQEKRHAALKGIPPATEDDLKLDLERLYAVADVGEPELIRLAHHWKQEAERRVDPLDPDFKIALAYEERITTLEKQLDTAESALDDYTDKALRLEAALLYTLYREGQANPSPAAVARVLREAIEKIKEHDGACISRSTGSRVGCDCGNPEMAELFYEAITPLIPESER